MESPAENREIKGLVEMVHVSSARRRRTHGPQKNFVREALIAALALISVHALQVPDAAAGSFSTIVKINAVVPARTQLKSIKQPATFLVTEADVRQGYVEVSGASLFEIWNNNPAGCVLTFESSDFPFREAAVTVMGREIIVHPTGGMIVLSVMGRQRIALDYRFILTSESQPGTYAWPLSVSVNPR